MDLFGSNENHQECDSKGLYNLSSSCIKMPRGLPKGRLTMDYGGVVKYLTNNVWNMIAIGSVMVLILVSSCKGEDVSVPENVNNKIHVLLIGASVGQAWDFKGLPGRLQNNSYSFEFIPHYELDKSQVIDQVLLRRENKPDIIIIKQCAAYFKSDTDTYDLKFIIVFKQLAEKWVKQCRENGVSPILATVVPITEKPPFVTQMKGMIKKYVLKREISKYNRQVRMKGISEYNDWVRQYSQDNGLAVLDLEKALHISETNRYLRPEYTTDGLHINKRAYGVLDGIVVPSLKRNTPGILIRD